MNQGSYPDPLGGGARGRKTSLGRPANHTLEHRGIDGIFGVFSLRRAKTVAIMRPASMLIVALVRRAGMSPVGVLPHHALYKVRLVSLVDVHPRPTCILLSDAMLFTALTLLVVCAASGTCAIFPLLPICYAQTLFVQPWWHPHSRHPPQHGSRRSRHRQTDTQRPSRSRTIRPHLHQRRLCRSLRQISML